VRVRTLIRKLLNPGTAGHPAIGAAQQKPAKNTKR
jgi:hypothetical protein